MTGKNILTAGAIIASLLISVSAYAGGGGGMGGGMGGGQGMMGGQGHGMTGSGGNSMMDFGPNYSNPWDSPQTKRSPSNRDIQTERERLRTEIHEKRQELAELYRSDKPDKTLIDQKIAELHALEKDYDQNLSGIE